MPPRNSWRNETFLQIWEAFAVICIQVLLVHHMAPQQQNYQVSLTVNL